MIFLFIKYFIKQVPMGVCLLFKGFEYFMELSKSCY